MRRNRPAWPLAARTGLVASGWTGITTAATYATLGALLWTGAMDLAVAGTAVIAVRTGSANLEGLVVQLNFLYEESLFVADLDRLCREADRRLIPASGVPLPEKVRTIRFENVSFTYPGTTDDKPALIGVDVTIPAGRIVALVGNNGSGKSTLAKLLCGLYAPDSGRILWDDVDTTEADRTALFDRVAVVAQDFYRWPFTARINVAIGRPEAPHDEPLLDAAAEYAGADETVASLPRGWDTLLARGYKGGHQISGGQWQRLGIARARHRDAQILVVDEPTSALDAEAEQRAFDQIRALSAEGQTVILITHRLHSVRHADEIYVLDEGSVTEHGSFDELMAVEEGAFRKMYLIQSRQYVHEGPARVPGQRGRVCGRRRGGGTEPASSGVTGRCTAADRASRPRGDVDETPVRKSTGSSARQAASDARGLFQRDHDHDREVGVLLYDTGGEDLAVQGPLPHVDELVPVLRCLLGRNEVPGEGDASISGRNPDSTCSPSS